MLSFVDDVEEHDLIDESQKKMITNIFELDDVTAGDVMTHRTEIVSVEENTPAATRYAFLWSTDFRASRYTASHWTTLSAFCM